MVFSMFGGFGLANEMADEIGVERKLYKSALTEVGVNFSRFKHQRAKLIEGGANSTVSLQVLTCMYVQELIDGIQILQNKFPHMSENSEAVSAIRKYVDEGPYKKNYQHYNYD